VDRTPRLSDQLHLLPPAFREDGVAGRREDSISSNPKARRTH
jgi:hypothetical protein